MKKAFILLCVVFCLSFTSYAQIPHLINYQGRLTNNSGSPLNGVYEVTFRIYDVEAGGAPLWQETHTGLNIESGIVSVMLGSITNLDLAFDKSYFLEIKVGAEVLSPRQRIASVGYAMRAENAEKVANTEVSATPQPNKILPLDSSGRLPASVLTGVDGYLPDSSVDITALKTAVGEIVHAVEGSRHYIVAGGTYCFWPQIKGSTYHSDGFITPGGYFNGNIEPGTTYETRMTINSADGTMYAQTRYLTASGLDHWIFLLVDKSTKEILSSWHAPDHPSYGNGGDAGKLSHPFGEYDESKQEIVLLDEKTCKSLEQESKQTGKSISTLINEEYKIDFSKKEKYEPLHSGKFLGQKPVMVEKIPDYISVRRLIKLTDSEKVRKKAEEESKRLASEQSSKQRKRLKESTVSKLRDILSDEEIKTLFGN